MHERFAIYYAPAPASPLRQRAIAWLGRDEMTGAALAAQVPGLDAPRRGRLTQSARRYGFHATLKPPMALASGSTRDRLIEAAAQFSRPRQAVPIGRLVLKPIDGFLALVPEVQSRELTAFAAECVTAFEAFRAPIAPAERVKRLESGLGAHQTGLLDQYGYPYVMDQFLFHMTLTDRLTPADMEAATAAARDWFAPVLEAEILLDRLALFHEPEPGAPFLRVADFPLSTKVTP